MLIFTIGHAGYSAVGEALGVALSRSGSRVGAFPHPLLHTVPSLARDKRMEAGVDHGSLLERLPLSSQIILIVYAILFVVSMPLLFAMRNSYGIYQRGFPFLLFYNLAGLFDATMVTLGCSLAVRLWDGNQRLLDRGYQGSTTAAERPNFRKKIILSLLARKRLFGDVNLMFLVLGATALYTGILVLPLVQLGSADDGCILTSVAYIANDVTCVIFVGLLAVVAWLLYDVEVVRLFPLSNFLFLFVITALATSVTWPVMAIAFNSQWPALKKGDSSVVGGFEVVATGKDADAFERLKSFAVREFCVELVLFIEAHNMVIMEILKEFPHEVPSSPQKRFSVAFLDVKEWRKSKGISHPKSDSNSSVTSTDSAGSIWRDGKERCTGTPTSTLSTSPLRKTRWTPLWADHLAHFVDRQNPSALEDLSDHHVEKFRMLLVDFVLQGAPNEINIEGYKRQEAIAKINSGHFAIDVLDRIREEVLDLLANNVWLKFKSIEGRRATVKGGDKAMQC
ncbi:hypothetical protein M427DRAFT_34329 [Gonapodya prolifera JEL478]|uniref:RGS domain-containing protein n=1 Tax=Gonapodya prolifera (strain JEL478) TaxID=1344416 RepID=A0A139A8R6_GONPJ|nr:hypothetical protein M427DRAFT_34329 [Gonapodya prolifera JEL478]|eukprot:KXS13104.1 hypothetical protein M427DRAFT_34329 [Gonapodya prolifera JEL478]